MSLEFRPSGNIFALLEEDPAAWLVCPVNCKAGVMGAGLAKAFAKRWPVLIDDHRFAVRTMGVSPGRVRVFMGLSDAVVVLFPTKDDWREPSQLRWITRGLANLGTIIGRHEPPITIGVPMLGCGLGGLDWRDVRPMIVSLATLYPDHRFVVYGSESD